MSLPVGGVVILVGAEITLGLGFQAALGLQDGAVNSLQRVGQDELSPIRAQDSLTLHADVGRHYQLHRVTFIRADQGQSDAGIPRSGFQDRLARPQHPTSFAVSYHPQRRPVLDRAAGVEPFRLGQDLHVG